MKLVKLQGGLGNQMFQYAVARALQEDSKKDVYLDITHFEESKVPKEGFTVRGYELHIFRKLRASVLNGRLRRFLLSKKIIFIFFQRMLGMTLHFTTQNENEFVEIPQERNLYLTGFFQSEKYFKQIRTSIVQDFTFPELDYQNRLLKEKIEAQNSVSIHVRRGDYIKSPAVLQYHGVLDMDYYKRAVALLEKNSTEPLTFYIFSEDEEFVKEEFSFLDSYHYVGNNTQHNSWKDMCLMKSCKHHIVANSSFSWWGAWLSEREGLKIAPDNWFNKQNVAFDIHDFVPENWAII